MQCLNSTVFNTARLIGPALSGIMMRVGSPVFQPEGRELCRGHSRVAPHAPRSVLRCTEAAARQDICPDWRRTALRHPHAGRGGDPDHHAGHWHVRVQLHRHPALFANTCCTPVQSGWTAHLLNGDRIVAAALSMPYRPGIDPHTVCRRRRVHTCCCPGPDRSLAAGGAGLIALGCSASPFGDSQQPLQLITRPSFADV